jgi:hypothetical protein
MSKYQISIIPHIREAIEDAIEIPFFQADWDNNGAPAIDEKIWSRATDFLIDYAESIHNLFNITIDAPVIGPCPDGSIDLSWRTAKARMLINIRNSDEGKAYYYGDQYNDRNSIKGNVDTSKVETFLAAWMCNLEK